MAKAVGRPDRDWLNRSGPPSLTVGVLFWVCWGGEGSLVRAREDGEEGAEKTPGWRHRSPPYFERESDRGLSGRVDGVGQRQRQRCGEEVEEST